MGSRLVIAGAGGFGRGLYGWLTGHPSYRETHKIHDVVFIDDRPPRWTLPAPIVSSIASYLPEPDDEVLCAIGSPGVRKVIVDRLQEVKARFHTYVDPRATLGVGVKVGTGSIVCPGSVLSADVALGEQVHINFNCALGHDTALGDFTTLSPGANIMGEVAVGRSVFVGGSAVVLPRLQVGDHCVIGAGAVVTSSLPEEVTVIGNPARPTNASGATGVGPDAQASPSGTRTGRA